MIKRLRCGNSRKLVKYHDRIYLDWMNTEIHQCCYIITLDYKDKAP